LGCVSDVDQREAREVGQRALQYAQTGDTDGSVTIHRVDKGGQYAAEYQLSPLDAVAGKTKVMDPSFIADSGHDVTDAFMDYLTPLVGSDMPVVARLEADPVAKILKK